eukprot:828590-Prorocentrum_minimum.AAC.1
MIAGLVLVSSRPAQRTGPLAPLFPAPRGNRRRLCTPFCACALTAPANSRARSSSNICTDSLPAPSTASPCPLPRKKPRTNAGLVGSRLP